MKEINNKVYAYIAPDGRLYIGQTRTSLERRAGSNGIGYKGCSRFYEAIKIFGWNNFKCIVIMENLSEEMCNILEIELIKKFNTTDPKYGFNISSGGKLDCLNKPVYQYNLSGEFIRGYKSTSSAVSIYGNGIYEAASGTFKSSYGYMWSHEKKNRIPPYKREYNVKNIMNNNKKCYQYDKDGNFVASYNSLAEASRSLDIYISSISCACNGMSQTAGGFQWRFDKYDNIAPIAKKISDDRAVYQYDALTNKFIREFSCLDDACSFLGKPPGSSAIRGCFSGINNTAYGYKWARNKSDYWSEDLLGPHIQEEKK